MVDEGWAELCRVVTNAQLAVLGGILSFVEKQVPALLLNAGDFVVNSPRLGSDLGQCGDEEAASRDGPPPDVGQVSVAHGKQTVSTRRAG